MKARRRLGIKVNWPQKQRSADWSTVTFSTQRDQIAWLKGEADRRRTNVSALLREYVDEHMVTP